VQHVKADKNRLQQKINEKPENSALFVPLETVTQLRERLKKVHPGLTDEELDHFM
jgi:hypothetical protein